MPGIGSDPFGRAPKCISKKAISYSVCIAAIRAPALSSSDPSSPSLQLPFHAHNIMYTVIASVIAHFICPGRRDGCSSSFHLSNILSVRTSCLLTMFVLLFSTSLSHSLIQSSSVATCRSLAPHRPRNRASLIHPSIHPLGTLNLCNTPEIFITIHYEEDSNNKEQYHQSRRQTDI